MDEERISLDSREIRLEGLLKKMPGHKAVVISHPHPLYGGDMHNNVVEAVCNAYQEKGYSSLRFNFRGVGRSEGKYDGGNGEQDDIEAALVHLSGLRKNAIDLVGYSFGAWVNALGLKEYEQVKRMIMISPPVTLMDFSFFKLDSRIKLVISGSEDEIANYRSIKDLVRLWNPDAGFRVIQGADHFYWGKIDELKAIIGNFLEQE
jgi:alpha/beta superfamily hydrolase